METDYLIVGSGCSGLFCALHLPKDKEVLVITKSDCRSSDSFLAQGGMCTLTCEEDYDSFFHDTLKAGHYENDKGSVEIMIRSSQDVVQELTDLGVDFQRDGYGNLVYTKEGAHSANRIVFHKDVTGKEITSHLLKEAQKRENITILEYVTLVDIIAEDNVCYGAVVKRENDRLEKIAAGGVVLATGGVGGAYKHSTNYRHLTGDAIAIAKKWGIRLRDIDYVQIHPTTLYTKESCERSFLISESMRGEGAKLYDKNGERFVDELLPRDVLTEAILKQMKKDGTEFVWEDLRSIPREELLSHFPNIVKHCGEAGYDVMKECIPVVPAQHYFMGGIWVDYDSKTSMEHLYAVGETACNGVHGRNRLASNSLLESLVFAKRAALAIIKQCDADKKLSVVANHSLEAYKELKRIEEEYRKDVEKIVKGEKDV